MEITQSTTFRRWLQRLSDRRAVARINARLRRATLDNLGDVRALGGGLWEMRIHYGPGYRLYYVRESDLVIVLLCGGDKDSQDGDIERARQLAGERS